MKNVAEYERISGMKCEREEFVRLENTRLAFSDARRFRQDYAELFAGAGPSEDMDAYGRGLLLRAGGMISRPHTSPNLLHELPKTSESFLVGYRPPRYGRAAIFELGDGEGL